MKDTIIQSVKATEVVVPSKPDSLNSESVHDKDTAFAKKFLTGASWTEFAIQPKWIIEIKLQNGLTGIGETYRNVSKEFVQEAINVFRGLDVLKINWRRLPVNDQRIYEAFETAVLDVVGKILHVPIHPEEKQCWRGSEVDLDILETMALHIAAASINCTFPSDIFGELVREDDPIEEPIKFEKGGSTGSARRRVRCIA